VGDGSSGAGLRYRWSQAPNGGPNFEIGLLAAKAPKPTLTPEEPARMCSRLKSWTAAASPAIRRISASKSKRQADHHGQSSDRGCDIVGKNPFPVGKEVRISSKVRIPPVGTDLQMEQGLRSALQAGARDDLPELAITPTAAGTFEFQLVVNNGAADSAPPPSLSKSPPPPARRPSSPNSRADGRGNRDA